MKRTFSLIILICILSFSLIGQKKEKTEFRYSTYKGLLMCGYQGWHNTPTDGSARGWTHLGKGGAFKPGSCNIDLWPDVSEYKKTYKTDFKLADSSNAYVYSSADESTTDLHFKWMKKYGIDGVFMQRFVAEVKREKGPFYFDGTISRETLENYLDRSVTMGYFLVPGTPENYQLPYKHDDIRMIKNMGAKFIGRAIYRWSEESRLGDPAFLAYAKAMIDTVHAFDPEVIFQGCLFESVTSDVNKLKIPSWVFTEFGLPVEDRTFSSDSIVKRTGRTSTRMGRGGVPIINNLECQLWYFYLVASYINIGCEAFHLGQVGLIGADDKDLKIYSAFLARARAYAKVHARRHYILLDGHVPSGGMVKDGVSLLDFNSFPLRIKAIPEKPYEAKLQVGYLDALFKRSKGCIAPSGWKCESLPYLVEFDNFGRGKTPNVADTTQIFIWGWDEISWFSLQKEEDRNNWLVYAWNWIKKTDPNGHLQMPVTRMISCPNETLRTYFANTKSPSCPVGYSQEETIKKIWNKKYK